MEILPPRALWLGCNSPTPDAVEETQGLLQGGIAPEMSQSHHLIASSQAAGRLRQESGVAVTAWNAHARGLEGSFVETLPLVRVWQSHFHRLSRRGCGLEGLSELE